MPVGAQLCVWGQFSSDRHSGVASLSFADFVVFILLGRKCLNACYSKFQSFWDEVAALHNCTLWSAATYGFLLLQSCFLSEKDWRQPLQEGWVYQIHQTQMHEKHTHDMVSINLHDFGCLSFTRNWNQVVELWHLTENSARTKKIGLKKSDWPLATTPEPVTWNLCCLTLRSYNPFIFSWGHSKFSLSQLTLLSSNLDCSTSRKVSTSKSQRWTS